MQHTRRGCRNSGMLYSGSDFYKYVPISESAFVLRADAGAKN
jgi:hypothetical protein